MKNVAVIMNTNELGGAERSLIFQLINTKEENITFFIPNISENRSLEKFLIASGFSNVVYFNYPESIYTLSRSKMKFGAGLISGYLKLIFDTPVLSSLSQFDIVYLNGNKAAFLFLLKKMFINFNGKIIWHLRDYYHSSKIMNTLWSLLKIGLAGKLSFICNSQSVKNSLKSSPWDKFPVEVIYNPVGVSLQVRDTTKEIKTIGFVSMMAPWKGVHELILWSKLFEEELIKLGINKIKIFGDDIYKTAGETSNYKDQLKLLRNKFNSNLVSFEGVKDPKEIFQEIDCLIHYSIRPEPFGRVILEAFEAGIPVISTCMGGAAELVQGQVTGIKVYPHDRAGLYLAVEQVVLDKIKTFRLISCGIEKSRDIQKNISSSMKKILEIGEAS